jgi:hypothetical protein
MNVKMAIMRTQKGAALFCRDDAPVLCANTSILGWHSRILQCSKFCLYFPTNYGMTPFVISKIDSNEVTLAAQQGKFILILNGVPRTV